jgi:hypothetical protein
MFRTVILNWLIQYTIGPDMLRQFNTQLRMSSADHIGSLVQSAERPGNGLHRGIVNFIFTDLVRYI